MAAAVLAGLLTLAGLWLVSSGPDPTKQRLAVYLRLARSALVSGVVLYLVPGAGSRPASGSGGVRAGVLGHLGEQLVDDGRPAGRGRAWRPGGASGTSPACGAARGRRCMALRSPAGPGAAPRRGSRGRPGGRATRRGCCCDRAGSASGGALDARPWRRGAGPATRRRRPPRTCRARAPSHRSASTSTTGRARRGRSATAVDSPGVERDLGERLELADGPRHRRASGSPT